MAYQRIGVDLRGGDLHQLLSRAKQAEDAGIGAIWLTMGIPGLDPLTALAAAAVQTRRVYLGTAIVNTWSRHPIAAVHQARTIDQLAPGRMRLGLGPSHEGGVTKTYGLRFDKPLTNLREYVQISRALLQQGSVEFEGYHYRVKATVPGVADVPVMASALRRKSWSLVGQYADGGISWVVPHAYLREVALPAVREAAEAAGRQEAPPIVAHVPVAVHDDLEAARAAAREQLGFYPRTPFYQAMFVDAGYPEAKEGAWSDAMIDAVMLLGDAEHVAAGLEGLFDAGMGELLVSIVTAGEDSEASYARTLEVVAEVQRRVEGSP